MDPLTHALAGAALVHALPVPDAGRRGALFGAILAAAPDLDFIPAFAARFPGNLIPGTRLFDPWWAQYHRGQTHSLFFALLAGATAGWAFRRFGGRKGPPFLWPAVGASALLSHVFLDLVNGGVALWLPFSGAWARLGDLPVVDPLTLGPLALWFFTVRLHAPRAGKSRLIAVCCLLLAGAGIAVRCIMDNGYFT